MTRPGRVGAGGAEESPGGWTSRAGSWSSGPTSATEAVHRFVPPIEGEVPVTRRRGYWVDAAVSPWRTFSEFLAKFFATKDDPAPFKVFWTHWRALPWQEAKQSTDPGDLRAKVEIGHPPEVVPARAVMLLADVDVQAHWLFYNLWAFGPGEEAWLVKHGTAESFDEVEEICLDRVYPYEDATDPKDPEQGLRGSFLGLRHGVPHQRRLRPLAGAPGGDRAAQGVGHAGREVEAGEHRVLPQREEEPALDPAVSPEHGLFQGEGARAVPAAGRRAGDAAPAPGDEPGVPRPGDGRALRLPQAEEGARAGEVGLGAEGRGPAQPLRRHAVRRVRDRGHEELPDAAGAGGAGGAAEPRWRGSRRRRGRGACGCRTGGRSSRRNGGDGEFTREPT